MAQRDFYHNEVVEALDNDGWRITDDPLYLAYGDRNLYVDLGAEPTIGAEKQGRKIAIEIKSFLNPSEVHDLGLSIGKYEIYREILTEIEPDREIYLAIPERAYNGIFQERLGQLMIEKRELKLIIFDPERKMIITWIES